MGTSAEILIPLAISALSTGGAAYNQHRVASRQEDEATKLMQNQQRQQQRADSGLNAELTTLEGSSPEAERQKALGGFLKMLRANATSSGGAGATAGGERFKEDTATSQAAIKNYGTQRADNLSRIVAPSRQRMNEHVGIGRAGDDVAGVARDANMERFLSMLRTQGIRPDPYLDAGSQIAGGIASGASSYYANRGPNTSLEPIAITAKRIHTDPRSVWAGRVPQPSSRGV